MNAKKTFLLMVLAAVLGVSCSRRTVPTAHDFIIAPKVLRMAGDKVEVIVNGRFPEHFVPKNGTVTVVPVLGNGTTRREAPGVVFQGEKAAGKEQQISHAMGGNFSFHTSFPYAPSLHASTLSLELTERHGDKVRGHWRYEVAQGVEATAALLPRALATARGLLAEDAFKPQMDLRRSRIIELLTEQIELRTHGLRALRIADVTHALQMMQRDNLEYADIVPHARWGDAENDDKRFTVSDWEGFLSFVGQSRLEERDTLLSYLHDFKDVAQLERTLRERSPEYGALIDGVMPHLRRARLSVNKSVIGRTDEEIRRLYRESPERLNADELLYASLFSEDRKLREIIYSQTSANFPQDYRAVNNLGVLAYEEGRIAEAERYFRHALTLKDAAEPRANLALVALAQGQTEDAKTQLRYGATAKNYNEIAGMIQIAEGRFDDAAESFRATTGNAALLAQVLANRHAAAKETFRRIAAPDGLTYYLAALLALRTKDTDNVPYYLQQSLRLDPTLRAFAAEDLELRPTLLSLGL